MPVKRGEQVKNDPGGSGLQQRQSRAEQTLDKKRRLLEAARDAFVREGYNAVTMDSIAQKAGVSKRSLYLWHEDKAALFRECVVEGALRFPAPSFDASRDLAASLRSFATELLREFIKPSTIGMGKLLIRESHEFAELAQVAERSRSQYLVKPIAEHLRQTGVAPDGSDEAAELLLSMILAPVHNHLLLGTALPRPKEIASHVATAIDVFLFGQTPKRRRTGEPED